MVLLTVFDADVCYPSPTWYMHGLLNGRGPIGSRGTYSYLNRSSDEGLCLDVPNLVQAIVFRQLLIDVGNTMVHPRASHSTYLMVV